MAWPPTLSTLTILESFMLMPAGGSDVWHDAGRTDPCADGETVAVLDSMLRPGTANANLAFVAGSDGWGGTYAEGIYRADVNGAPCIEFPACTYYNAPCAVELSAFGDRIHLFLVMEPMDTPVGHVVTLYLSSAGGGAPRLGLYAGYNAGADVYSGEGAALQGAWTAMQQHYLYVHQARYASAELYVDGSLVDSGTETGFGQNVAQFLLQGSYHYGNTPYPWRLRAAVFCKGTYDAADAQAILDELASLYGGGGAAPAARLVNGGLVNLGLVNGGLAV